MSFWIHRKQFGLAQNSFGPIEGQGKRGFVIIESNFKALASTIV